MERLTGSKKQVQMVREEHGEAEYDLIQLPSFYIDRYLVTNARYREFLRENGYKRRSRCLESRIWGSDQKPLVGIMWQDAQA